MKNKNYKLLSIILPIISILVIIALWAIASIAVGSDYILPSITATLNALFNIVQSAEFYLSLGSTLLRSAIAFLVSFVLAVVFAYLSKKYFIAEKILSPIIKIVRALPTIAIVLLLLFWTNSMVAPCIVTSLVVFPTLYTGVKASFDGVDDKLITACQIHGVSNKDIFFKVQLPQVLPSLIVSVGAGLSLNVKLMVAAEVLSQTANSIGYMLNTSKIYFEIATMLALVLVTVIICVIIEAVFGAVSKKVGKWQ